MKIYFMLPFIFFHFFGCKNSASSSNKSGKSAYTFSEDVVQDSRMTTCTQNPGHVWKDERCINQGAIDEEKEKCKQEKKIWLSKEARCVDRTEAKKTSCEQHVPPGVWLDGQCYGAGEEKPKACPKEDEVFDGRNCVPPETKENFYRLCYRKSIEIERARQIMALKRASGLKKCGQVYDYLLAATTLELMHGNLTTLDVISEFSQLKELRLGHNSLSDLSELSKLTHLQLLWLEQNNISDISSLGVLTALKELDLSENPIADITVLSAVQNLETLNLSNTQVESLTDLRHHPRITSLAIAETPLGGVLQDPNKCPLDAKSDTIVRLCSNSDN